jgi:hypothetical protein
MQSQAFMGSDDRCKSCLLAQPVLPQRAGTLLFVLGFLVWPRVASSASLSLAWASPTDGMTTGYLLLYGMKSGTYSTQIDVGGATSYTVTGLAAARTYYFTVRARSAAGVLSAPAAEVSGTTPGISPAAANADDFNQDDVQDLLFQSTAGDPYAWYMNGTSFVSVHGCLRRGSIRNGA